MIEEEKQQCPICKAEVKKSTRYPKYICEECTLKVTDKDGRSVYFANTTLLGFGCQGHYRDKNEIYNSHFCFVNGILCVAEEARFGGIVIQEK
jgi:hypothetical protein